MDHGNKGSAGKKGARESGGKMRRLADLLDVIQAMTEQEFTGHIKINFSQGGIGRIEKYEEILRGRTLSE